MNKEEWDYMKQFIEFNYLDDSHMSELKDIEVMNSRMQTIVEMQPIIGKYMSHQSIRQKIMKQTMEDMQDEDQKIMQELQNPILYPPPDALMPPSIAPKKK